MSTESLRSVSDLVLEAIVQNADIKAFAVLAQMRVSRVQREVRRRLERPTRQFLIEDLWIIVDKIHKSFDEIYDLNGISKTKLVTCSVLELTRVTKDCLQQSILPVVRTLCAETKKVIIKPSETSDSEDTGHFAEIISNCHKLENLEFHGDSESLKVLIGSLNLSEVAKEDKINFELRISCLVAVDMELLTTLVEKIGNRTFEIVFIE